jgi:hypothetical protein
MTEAIVQALAENRYDSAGQALNFAVGALIAHDTARGASPFQGVDVERLFAAVQMLAERESLEVAPFVAAWDPALESFGQQLGRFPAFFQRDMQKALVASSGWDIERLLKTAIASQIPRPDASVFERVQTAMIMQLRRLVAVEPKAVEYLSPLLNLTSPIRIASLNYDLGVESMAAGAGASVDTGIAAWGGGHAWSWNESAQVRLLKLHGSIDWVASAEPGAEGRLREPRVEVTADPVEDRRRPYVVFGARGKLTAEGPFLAMLQQLDVMLASLRTLLVVGYSFRDDHINIALRRWLNSRPDSVLIVLDREFVSAPGGRRERDFRSELSRALGTADPPRLVVHPRNANPGLEELLGASGQLAVHTSNDD